MLKYLEPEEKIKSRILWEEVFTEDSKQFLDYYYREKTVNNLILVREEDGVIQSMLHRNPYWISVKGEKQEIDYLVAVATRENCRHQGYMREVLTQALQDMNREKRTWTFLMPADEKIYLPFDFTYIFNQPSWRLKQDVILHREPFDATLLGGDFPRVTARWCEEWLKTQYDVYCFRSEDYICQMDQELKSENGGMTLLYDGENLIGVQSVWGMEKTEQRELLCLDDYRETPTPPKPAIMARIVNLAEFVHGICLHEDSLKSSLTVKLRVRDNLIIENEGTWLWQLNKQTSYLERIDNENTLDIPEFSISELTSWLFGYNVSHKAEWCDGIQPLTGIFLDEIV